MRIRTKVASTIGAVILGLGLAVAIPSPASAAMIGPVRIKPNGTNLCLDVRDVSYANGAPLQLWQCLGAQYNQHFYLVETGVAWRYQIVARHSAKCVDVRDVSYADNAQIQQWDCLGLGQTNQLFVDVDAGGGLSYLQAWHSGKCLSYFLPPIQGGNVVQFSCYNRWQIAFANI